MEHLVEFQEDRATLIHSDRDAFQLQVSELKAITADSLEELQSLDLSNIENLQQVWERVTGPCENFTPVMFEEYERFNSEYTQWETESRELLSFHWKYMRMKNPLRYRCKPRWMFLSK